MPVPGANGIDNGVLISMSGLNEKKMINNNENCPGRSRANLERRFSIHISIQ